MNVLKENRRGEQSEGERNRGREREIGRKRGKKQRREGERMSVA